MGILEAMSPRAWNCLILVFIVLWMVIISILLGVNKRMDNKRARKNEKDHSDFRKTYDSIQSILRRIEGGIKDNESYLKKTAFLVQNKIAPMMERNEHVKELQRLLDVETEKFEKERKLTVELGMELKRVNDILKKRSESEKKEKISKDREGSSKEGNSRNPAQ